MSAETVVQKCPRCGRLVPREYEYEASPVAFHGVYSRMLTALGVHTEAELAKALGIQEESIADAKRRGVIPLAWPALLLLNHGTNPAWVMTGEWKQRLDPYVKAVQQEETA